jgi:predicted nucleic acid-binding protein
MAILLDTSILLRFVNATDPQHAVALHAIRTLHAGGQTLQVAPQILVEFRNSATRPISANGLGLTPEAADRHIEAFEKIFPLILENPDLHPAWKSLVATGRVIGKQVHDARIAAIAQVNRVEQILTFNVRHFARFAAIIPDLSVVDPASV